MEKVTARPFRENRLQFAKLHSTAAPILAKDTIYVSDPGIYWPCHALERRRIFNGLLCSYYRQIMHGCVSQNCKTITCLSYQKKATNKPFRRFTVLSARTLAAFLAAQDHPEKGLCPNTNVALPEEPEVELFRKECHTAQEEINSSMKRSAASRLKSLTLGHSPKIGSPDTGNCNKNMKADYCTGNHELAGTRGVSVDTVANQNNKMPRGERMEKDPKSFTQNLFDTIVMKRFHLSEMEWYRTPPVISQDLVGSIARNTIPVMETREKLQRSNIAQSAGSLNIPRKAPTETFKEPAPLSRRYLEAINDTHPTRQLLTRDHATDSESLESSPTTFQGLGTINTADRSLHQDKGNYHYEEDRSESTDNLSKKAATTQENPTFKSQVINLPFSRLALDSNCMMKPGDLAPDPVAQPQALKRFTLENILELVKAVKMADPGSYDEHSFSQSLGRTRSSFSVTGFLKGHATQQEMSALFVTQSIIYVLSTVDALLVSFITPADADSLEYKRPATLLDITRAFRLLMDIDFHPRSIVPSLWNSVNKLQPPSNLRSKTALCLERRSTNPHRSSLSIGLDSDLVNNQLMSDFSAVHIVKIALAALIASVPECNEETWSAVRKLRASGKIAPDPQNLRLGRVSMDATLEVMDSYGDEMALSLMKRVVRAIAARQCMSEISRYPGLGTDKDKTSTDNGEAFMNILLREVTDSDATDINLAQHSVVEGGFSATQGPTSQNPMEESSKSLISRRLHIYAIIEWLRSVILSEWDGKPEVPRWGPMGGALEFLVYLSRLPAPLGLAPETYHTPFLSERLNITDMLTDWLSSQQDSNTVHLLSYPFLFLPSTLVSYFRAINHTAMFRAFESSLVAAKFEKQMTFTDLESGRGKLRLHDRLRTAMCNHFVLEIRRGDVLTDALNQLWRRERRELMRPLKVRMGMDEGEEGQDHGGVQQEFFRVALSEALRPDYGLFSTDTESRMSWFQPCSFEPLYKFELLGLLTSLAVYNGLTLPVTFPLALYRKLLNFPVTQLAHIQDGWPILANSFKSLLAWSTDNVESVYGIDYVFSVEGPGKIISVDMERTRREDEWPPFTKGDVRSGETSSPIELTRFPTEVFGTSSHPFKPSLGDQDRWSEPPVDLRSLVQSRSSSRAQSGSILPSPSMVTNKNRDQYVNDYIFWLTDKSIRPQYEAFAQGFYTCLDRKAATLFTPEALKLVVEGIQEINLDALQQVATYEGGYWAGHRVIKDFWDVVRQFPPTQLRQLLEFVTASDRIPVNGISSISFTILKSGVEDERLPTSLTCFGRLLLPEYSSREKLNFKLCTAIANCKGFGVA